MIRAAGGVLVQDGGDGTKILVVHRPRYDDWTFPKGKAVPGETDEECALREVEEETGLRCEIDRELPPTRYVDSRGRSKRVRYWLMRPIGGRLEFLHEVDDAVWVSPDDARELLSHARDRPVLDGF